MLCCVHAQIHTYTYTYMDNVTNFLDGRGSRRAPNRKDTATSTQIEPLQQHGSLFQIAGVGMVLSQD